MNDGKVLWSVADLSITKGFGISSSTVVSSSVDFLGSGLGSQDIAGLGERELLRNQEQNALQEMSFLKDDIKYWAIHPGGKKILKEVEKALSLDVSALQVSRNILSNYGNMSSATLLYVLEAMRKQIERKDEPVFCAGFGPGLTIETMILKSC